MPGDVSSSCEDEVEPNQNERSSKYECPADFVSLSYKSCGSMLTEHLKKRKSELWLVKAPVNFDPECVKDMKLSLSGLQSVKVPGKASSQQIFNILASPQCSPDMHLLTSSTSSDQMLVAPPFSGLLDISESYGCSEANGPPLALPAAPAPTIPPGLKLRFHPFGSKTPTQVKTEVDGLLGADDKEGRKKKKKKKKKQIKTEPVEEQVIVKQEPVDEVQSESTTEVLSGEKKKKKKKRDRQEEVEVKQESEAMPTDCFMDPGEPHVKKKKKKNKSD
ncbi:CD3e molecule, epsilon associated protein isoform X2 [Synchiropus splendidus]|uniref:CD3e molecule, epsilon associated protein isoform X2 n=1 Tax=Synchiropus splendidus TaxID=270530 RepID=UPI00237DD6DF|nr:CD3e molecule, epsilon associated protein isoform X2 [Synchiropus splendidus]